MTQLLWAIQEEAVFAIFVSQHLRHEPTAKCSETANHLIGQLACDGCDNCREARELFNRGYARSPRVFRDAVIEVEVLVRSHDA